MKRATLVLRTVWITLALVIVTTFALGEMYTPPEIRAAERALNSNESWPDLPTQILGLAGPIPVLRPDSFPDPQQIGEWDPNTREIRVLASLDNIEAWWVLFHEISHASTDEAGVELPEEYWEPVANATADGMLRAMAPQLVVLDYLKGREPQ